MSDGRITGTGANTSGQLLSADLLTLSPVPMEGIGNAVSTDAGFVHSVAALADGTAWSWGDNSVGQLGDGTSVPESYVAVQAVGITNIVEVAAGDLFTLAVDSNGEVWSWGDNFYGQLGDGTTKPSSHVPVKVLGLTGVIHVAGGQDHAMAVKGDGTVWAWGSNAAGKLGDGTQIDRNVPVQVQGLPPIPAVAVAAGGAHSLAALANGSVWGWGDNTEGQLGLGFYSPGELSPLPALNLTSALVVRAGISHSLALQGDGTVWAWGNNGDGILGIGNPPVRVNEPTQVPSLSGVTVLGAGRWTSFAVTGDGRLWAWGHNWGKLGDGTIERRFFPVEVQLDAPPPDQGNVLYAARQGVNVSIGFPRAPPSLAWRVYADQAPPLGLSPLTPDATARSYLDLGAITRNDKEYYQVKGLSRCTETPGP